MTRPIGDLEDCTEAYMARNLHAEGIWPSAGNLRYGGAVFDLLGRILLREPANHFSGYVWTFPKGGANDGEPTAAAALREVREETGLLPQIIGHLPDAFPGGAMGWPNFYYLMLCLDDAIDPERFDSETWNARFVEQTEAWALIALTKSAGGRERDLKIVDAAYRELERLLA